MKLMMSVAAVIFASALATGQTAPPLEYDAYCKLPTIEAKQDARSRMSAANRAEILRTHYERFLSANRARLNADQVALLDQAIAVLSPLTPGERPLQPLGRKAEA